MKHTGAFPIAKAINSAQQSGARPIQYTPKPIQFSPVYFALQLKDASGTEINASALRPGQYWLVVSVSRSGRSDQPHWTFASDIELCLQVIGHASVNIIDPLRQIPLPSFDNTLLFKFQVEVAEDCSGGEVLLELGYREVLSDEFNSHFGLLPITRFMANVESNRDSQYADIAEASRLLLNKQPPECAAILRVISPEVGKLRLIGWSKQNRIDIGELDQPVLDLAHFVEDQVKPESIRNIVRSFSRRSPVMLLDWLDALLSKFGEQLMMIIADHSDIELPWEMFEIEDERYLGTQAIVVRWLPVKYFRSWKHLDICEETMSGTVVSFLDESDTSHINNEKQVLTELNAAQYVAINLFKERLLQPLQDVCLVYLGCHGIFTHEGLSKRDVITYALSNPSNRLTHLDLEGIGRQEDPLPIFLINSCHSARLIRGGSFASGLPEVLLARIASGVIGTLGPVGSQQASEIGSRVINAIKDQADGVQPAEILRRLRQESVDHLARNSESKDAWLRFLYTFMYVYYGNPLARLQLFHGTPEEAGS